MTNSPITSSLGLNTLVSLFAAAQWGKIVETLSEKSKATGWSQIQTGS